MYVNFFAGYPGGWGVEPATLVDLPSMVSVTAEPIAAYRTNRDGFASINVDLGTADWPVLGILLDLAVS